MAGRPEQEGTRPPGKSSQSILPSVGVDPGPNGGLIPIELLAPLVEAKVGQMKAEMERDIKEQLGKLDDMPTRWQLWVANGSAIIIGLTLFFAIASYFGDRQDKAVESSATISGALSRIDQKLDTQIEQEQKAADAKPAGPK